MAKKKKHKKSEGDAPSPPQWPDVGGLLGFGHRVFHDRAAEKIRGRGHPAIRVSHLAVVRHMSAEGTRITELARHAGMTKQAMGQLVRELVDMAYLELRPDQADRRAKLATYTESGRGLAADVRESLADVQGEFKRALGKKGLKDLRKLLSTLEDEFGQG